MFIVFISF